MPEFRGFGCRGFERGRASGQCEAFEDHPRHGRIFDCGDEPQCGSAAWAAERIDLEYTLKQRSPS
jgi:hypothetical protein